MLAFGQTGFGAGGGYGKVNHFGVTQGGHSFLRNQYGVTDRAMLAFGQTGSSAGGFLCPVYELGVSCGGELLGLLVTAGAGAQLASCLLAGGFFDHDPLAVDMDMGLGFGLGNGLSNRFGYGFGFGFSYGLGNRFGYGFGYGFGNRVGNGLGDEFSLRISTGLSLGCRLCFGQGSGLGDFLGGGGFFGGGLADRGIPGDIRAALKADGHTKGHYDGQANEQKGDNASFLFHDVTPK